MKVDLERLRFAEVNANMSKNAKELKKLLFFENSLSLGRSVRRHS